jgi:hypothetical protein
MQRHDGTDRLVSLEGDFWFTTDKAMARRGGIDRIGRRCWI